MATYYLQSDGEVEALEEQELRKRLRKKDLTGLEHVRRDGESEWRHLYDTELYREEVPVVAGNPRLAALQRHMSGFLGHLSAYGIATAVQIVIGIGFQFWMWIWGVVLLVHGLKTAPSAFELHRSGELLPGGRPRPSLTPAAPVAALPPGQETTGPIAAANIPSDASEIEIEAIRVRELLARRTGPDAAAMQREVDEIVARARDLAVKEASLAEQTTLEQIKEVDHLRAEASQRLAAGVSDDEKRLVKRQLETLDSRKRAIAQARKDLDRLRLQRTVAEQALKQLRLELSRADATDAEIPGVADRLHEIRAEVAAAREVEKVLND